MGDPHRGNDLDRNKITQQMFETLVELNHSSSPRPGIATWSIEGKKKAIVFRLRDRYFSDGSKLASLDVIRSIVRSNSMGNYLKSHIKNLGSCRPPHHCSSFEIKSPKEFRMILTSNNYKLILKTLAGTEGRIVKELPDGHIVGTGCYLEQNQTKEILTLRKRNEPWCLAYLIDILNFRVTSTENGYNDFKAGKIDMINSIQYHLPKVVDGIEAPIRYMGTIYLGFNFRPQSVTRDRRARAAFLHALDRKQFSLILGDESYEAGTFITKGYLGYRRQLTKLDQKKAQDLIKLSGLAGRSLRLVASDKYKSSTKFGPYWDKVGQTLGLTISVDLLPFRDVLKEFRKGRADLILKGDGVQNYDPATMYAAFLTQSNANVTQFISPALDELVSAASAEADEKKTKVIIENIEKLIAKDIPLIPLSYPTFRRWWSPRLVVPKISAHRLQVWHFDLRGINLRERR